MAFVKLVKCNDWGREFLTMPGEGKSLGDSRNAVSLNTVERYTVRWPDGHQEVVYLTFHSRSAVVSDHGRESTVRFTEPGVRVQHHGASVWVPLERLEIDLPEPSPTPVAESRRPYAIGDSK